LFYLQGNLFPGFHFSFLLVLPHLKTGINFGLTAMLLGLCNCIKLGKVTAVTRTYIHATDGGSENRAKLMHALNYMLVKFGVVDEIVGCRLPPSHSHDYVDRVFLAVEQWLTDPGQGGSCYTPWEMRAFLLRKFATSPGYKDHNVAVETLVANINFQQWLYGSCDEKNLIIKELTRDDGTKYRPEPLVWRYRWDSKLGKPVVHYKPDLRVGGSFNQSKWGP